VRAADPIEGVEVIDADDPIAGYTAVLEKTA